MAGGRFGNDGERSLAVVHPALLAGLFEPAKIWSACPGRRPSRRGGRGSDQPVADSPHVDHPAASAVHVELATQPAGVAVDGASEPLERYPHTARSSSSLPKTRSGSRARCTSRWNSCRRSSTAWPWMLAECARRSIASAPTPSPGPVPALPARRRMARRRARSSRYRAGRRDSRRHPHRRLAARQLPRAQGPITMTGVSAAQAAPATSGLRISSSSSRAPRGEPRSPSTTTLGAPQPARIRACSAVRASSA